MKFSQVQPFLPAFPSAGREVYGWNMSRMGIDVNLFSDLSRNCLLSFSSLKLQPSVLHSVLKKSVFFQVTGCKWLAFRESRFLFPSTPVGSSKNFVDSTFWEAELFFIFFMESLWCLCLLLLWSHESFFCFCLSMFIKFSKSTNACGRCAPFWEMREMGFESPVVITLDVNFSCFV